MKQEPRLTIDHKDGNILRFLRNDDPTYSGFGEVYFSEILPGRIKGWKLHRRMMMNLTCVYGSVRFRTYANTPNAPAQDFLLSPNQHSILCIEPNTWFAFGSVSPEKSIICNFSSIIHSEDEVVRKPISFLSFF